MAALAAIAAWAVATVLAGGAARLLARAGVTASNYRGRTVPQGAGFVLPLAYLVGMGVLLLGGLLPPATVWPAVAGCFALGLAGAVDDAAGRGEPKGWLGHARALMQGRLTAGSFKAASGLAIAALIGLSLSGGAGAAASAIGPNLVNTLDTRPARALWTLGVGGTLLAAVAGPWTALPLLPMLGAALGLLPLERRQALMWGDAGANAAGFALGWSWALAGAGPAWAFAGAAAAIVVVGDRLHLGAGSPPLGRDRQRNG